MSEHKRWLAAASAVAAILLGIALQLSSGFLRNDALVLTLSAFGILIAALLVPRPGRFVEAHRSFVPVAGFIGLFAHVGLLLTYPIGLYIQATGVEQQTLQWPLTAMALAGGSLVWGSTRRSMLVPLATLVAAHLAIGFWVIRHSPVPPIDVDLFHRFSVASLRDGINPYDITFPDIYKTSRFYGPGLSAGGQLQFGYPYFPLSLLAVWPGVTLGGDPRYSQLVAMELAGVCMAFAGPARFGPLAAALYLTTPRTFFVLEQSWTEPFLVLGLAATVLAARRYDRLTPWLFGAFIALKQYLVLALPAAALLVGWPFDWRRMLAFVARAAALGTAVTLPFFLWNPAAFWRSVVTLQLHQPFRYDALSVLAWWAARGNGELPSLVAFVAAGLLAALALWRVPRTPAGFAVTVASTLFAFFLFNKQAFCNYYFFVVGALCVALAASDEPAALS